MEFEKCYPLCWRNISQGNQFVKNNKVLFIPLIAKEYNFWKNIRSVNGLLLLKCKLHKSGDVFPVPRKFKECIHCWWRIFWLFYVVEPRFIRSRLVTMNVFPISNCNDRMSSDLDPRRTFIVAILKNWR